jgi:hypothetical protein
MQCSEQELYRLFSEGRVNGTTIIWKEGMATWLPLAQTELAHWAPSAAPPPVPQGHPYPSAQGWNGPKKTSGSAVASMILGILSFLLWILASIPAIICGHLSLSSINRSRGALQGRGMAISGLVMGYLTLAVGGIFVLGAFPLYAKIMAEMKAKTTMRTGYQIHQALFAYALDHDQKFPDSLQDLVTSGLVEPELLTKLPAGYPADYWEYRGKGMQADETPTDAIILQGKPQNKFRVVVHVGGACKVLRGEGAD